MGEDKRMSRKRIVADKWQIIDEIGSGGQGKIYKVRNISNSTDTNTFALKYLKSQKIWKGVSECIMRLVILKY